jgi:hypothetical protein
VEKWSGWDASRGALVMSFVLFLGMWVQLTLMHWAGGFRHKAMWGPVIATPLFAAAALVGLWRRDGLIGWAVLALLVLSVIEGLMGLGFHLKGIAAQVGGWSVRNMLSGPPPMLPLAYTLVGVLGIGAVVWTA